MRILYIVVLFFVGCNEPIEQTTTTPPTSTDSTVTITTTTPIVTTPTKTTITVVDGYIKDATLSDASGKSAIYLSGGLYEFTGDVTYPINSSGGRIIKTDESFDIIFDISMSAYDGLVVSPITTFLQEDTTLKNNLLNITSSSSSELQSDYIKEEDIKTAKISQILYAILRYSDSTTAFKAAIKDTTSQLTLEQLHTLALNSTNHHGSRAIILMSNIYSGDATHLEDFLEKIKYETLYIECNQSLKVSTTSTLKNACGVSYNVIQSPITGKWWIDRNLGATKAGDSGSYFQWGGKYEDDGVTPIFVTTDDVSDDWVSDDDTRARRLALWNNYIDGVCPIGFRVPTKDELNAELSSVSNKDEAYSNFLKLPAQGAKLNDGSLTANGDSATLWTTSRDGNAYYFFDGAFNKDVGDVVGFPIRCIRNN